MDKSDTHRLNSFTMTRHRFASLCLVGYWPDQAQAFGKHWSNATAAPFPDCGTRAIRLAQGWAFRVHPYKVLLASVSDTKLTARFSAGFNAAIGTLSEQSHGRMCLRLNGQSSWEVLQACLPLDPGHALKNSLSYVQTRLGDANVLVFRSDTDQLDVFVPTSFVDSVESALARQAQYVIK